MVLQASFISSIFDISLFDVKDNPSLSAFNSSELPLIFFNKSTTLLCALFNDIDVSPNSFSPFIFILFEKSNLEILPANCLIFFNSSLIFFINKHENIILNPIATKVSTDVIKIALLYCI